MKRSLDEILNTLNSTTDRIKKAYLIEEALVSFEKPENVIKRRTEVLALEEKTYVDRLKNTEFTLGKVSSNINKELEELKNLIALRNKYSEILKAIEESTNDINSLEKYVQVDLNIISELKQLNEIPSEIGISNNIVLGYLQNKLSIDLYMKVASQLNRKEIECDTLNYFQ